MKYFLFILVPFLCLLGCEKTTQKTQNEPLNSEAAQDFTSDKDADNRAIRNAVYRWNVANNSWDTSALRLLIAPKTKMYGKKMDTQQACDFFYERFREYSHYSQKVVRDFRIEAVSENKKKASFIRTIDWGETKTELPTAITFEKINDKWLIIEENELGNKPIESKKPENEAKLSFSSCESLCKSVIMSSSVYKSFAKNNPNSDLTQNTSATSIIRPQKRDDELEFVLNANGGANSKQVFFVVYTQKAKLSAYNVADKKEQPIPYDEKFEPYFRDACK